MSIFAEMLKEKERVSNEIVDNTYKRIIQEIEEYNKKHRFFKKTYPTKEYIRHELEPQFSLGFVAGFGWLLKKIDGGVEEDEKKDGVQGTSEVRPGVETQDEQGHELD